MFIINTRLRCPFLKLIGQETKILILSNLILNY